MLNLKQLKPVQSLAASLFLRCRKLMLVLPRQEGKTELGVRIARELHNTPETRTTLFLAKSKVAGKKAVREKFSRLFDQETFAVNTEIVYRKDCVTSNVFMDSVDKDPDRIRGGTYHYVHWSEVAFSKLDHGVTINDVYQKIIAPATRKANGYVLLESTMNGKNGWNDLLENCKELGFSKLVVPFSQMLNMGLVTLEEYLAVKNTTHPDIFRQEYECEAVTFQGRAYPEFTEELIVEMPNPESWQVVCFAVDWGFTAATCVLWGYIKDGEINVFHEHYQVQEMPEVTAGHINTTHTHYEVARPVGCGDHDPAKNEELRRRGIKVGLADKVNVLGNRMQIKELLWKKKLKIHPRCKMLIKDLQAAVWDVKTEGELDEKQCTWGHFDAEAALRYLVREFSRLERTQPEKNPHSGPEGDEMSEFAHDQRRARLRR